MGLSYLYLLKTKNERDKIEAKDCIRIILVLIKKLV